MFYTVCKRHIGGEGRANETGIPPTPPDLVRTNPIRCSRLVASPLLAIRCFEGTRSRCIATLRRHVRTTPRGVERTPFSLLEERQR